MNAQPPSIAYVASSAYVFLSFFTQRFKALQNRGLSVTCYSPEDAPVGKLRDMGIEHVCIPMGRSPNPAAAAASWLLLTREFRRRKHRLVHSHTTTTHLLAASASRSAQVPVHVATIHGHYHTGLDALQPPLIRELSTGISRVYYRAISSLVDAYIVINQTEKETLKNLPHFPSEKLRLLPGGVGVPLDTFQHQKPQHRPAAREKLGLDTRRNWIGFFGRLRDHKARGLLQILDLVHRQSPNTGVLLAALKDGDAALEEGIARRIQNGRPIHLLRNQEAAQMPDLYASLDLLLLPSLREGASTVLMEAAAMGVPAIAYEIAGTRDIIEHQRTGILVSPDDEAAFAQATLDLLRRPDLRQNMSTQARHRAETHFSRQRSTETMIAVYDELLHLKNQPF